MLPYIIIEREILHFPTLFPSVLFPFPIPRLILNPFSSESRGTHGIPVFPMFMHISNVNNGLLKSAWSDHTTV